MRDDDTRFPTSADHLDDVAFYRRPRMTFDHDAAQAQAALKALMQRHLDPRDATDEQMLRVRNLGPARLVLIREMVENNDPRLACFDTLPKPQVPAPLPPPHPDELVFRAVAKRLRRLHDALDREFPEHRTQYFARYLTSALAPSILEGALADRDEDGKEEAA